MSTCTSGTTLRGKIPLLAKPLQLAFDKIDQHVRRQCVQFDAAAFDLFALVFLTAVTITVILDIIIIFGVSIISVVIVDEECDLLVAGTVGFKIGTPCGSSAPVVGVLGQSVDVAKIGKPFDQIVDIVEAQSEIEDLESVLVGVAPVVSSETCQRRRSRTCRSRAAGTAEYCTWRTADRPAAAPPSPTIPWLT